MMRVNHIYIDLKLNPNKELDLQKHEIGPEGKKKKNSRTLEQVLT